MDNKNAMGRFGGKMRKIKFRGKRVDNGEWVYGHLTDTDICHIGVAFDSFDSNGNEIIDGEVHEVVSKTVGQFTGLQDKNGNDIYEGDILESNNKQHKGIIHFDYGMFLLKDEENESLPAREYSSWEIIGNIHE